MLLVVTSDWLWILAYNPEGIKIVMKKDIFIARLFFMWKTDEGILVVLVIALCAF